MAENKTAPPKGYQTALVQAKAECFPLSFPEEWVTGKADGCFLTSMDKAIPAGRKAIMAALNDEMPGLETQLNIEIAVAGVTCHPATKTVEDSGEVLHLVRTVLHLADGSCLESYGDGVLKSLRVLQTLDGAEMFAKPRRCIPKRVATSGGRSMYRLQWLD